MAVLRTLRESLRPVVDLVYPPRCPLCGAALAAADGVCAACWSTLDLPGEPACSTCRRPLADDGAVATGGPARRCTACVAVPPPHDGIVAATLYNPASRQLVLAFKHGGRIAHAGLFARMIAARLPVLDDGWLIVPVPLHRSRLWRRGYNQAALIGGALARRTGHAMLVDALIRTRPTPSLGGLGRAARARALDGAVAVRPGRRGRIEGRSILLVDDVLTTGATSNACVAALRGAGAKRVMPVCFARVVDDRDAAQR